jgi:protein required for attachment to host cells
LERSLRGIAHTRTLRISDIPLDATAGMLSDRKPTGGGMQKTWVVVADRVRGRIFSASTPKGPLTELEDLVHPEARAHERDLTTDRPGRGPGSHRAMGTDYKRSEHEASGFAREIAARLETGRNNADFAKLVLVAAPDFLGLLRKSLNPHVEKLVAREITKNLTHLPPEDIRAHLPEYL